MLFTLFQPTFPFDKMKKKKKALTNIDGASDNCQALAEALSIQHFI